MNDVLMEAGLDNIDDSWVLVPVGGAGKLSTFVSLIGANQLKLGVIMDSSTKDADAVKRLTESGRLDKGSLIQMSEIAGRASADIEDLFDPEFYLELVNRAYAGPLAGTPITVADLGAGDRITRRIAGVFAQRGIDSGKLDHYRPSRVLLRQQSDLIPQIDDATRRRFEQLAQRVNIIS